MCRRLCVHGGTGHELDFSVSVLLLHIFSGFEMFLRLVPHDLSVILLILPWWFVDHSSSTVCVCVYNSSHDF